MSPIAKRSIVLLLFVGVTCVSLWGQDEISTGACPPEVTAWLIDNAIPFVTTDPMASLDDLEPLRDIIGDAQIIGLGEQTHGTKEFFEMKHRIFRLLVEEMGFRVLAFESDWYGLIELNECLLPDGPPIESAFSNLVYWPWNTEEVMALLRWIRAYNCANSASLPVQLVGLDVIPQTVQSAAESVNTYLQRVAFDESGAVRSVIAQDFTDSYSYLSAIYASSRAGIEDPVRAEAVAGVLAPVAAWMEANRDLCIANSSPAEYDLALRTLKIAANGLVFMATPEEAAVWTLRDRWQAENVTWWLQFLDQDKLAIWEHNAHIVRHLSIGDPRIPMGLLLSETYGDSYLPIGFSFAEGDFSAWGRHGPRAMTARSLIPGCYEAALLTCEQADFMLDLREVERESAAGDWMYTERDFRTIGPVYGLLDLGWDSPTVLPEAFDVIIHINRSTATTQWTSQP